MTKQTIGIGTIADDGTGDTIRDAMDKCNDNFDGLFNPPISNVGNTSYTLSASDSGKVLNFSNNGNVTITVPNTATVTFSNSDFIELHQGANGVLVFTPAGGVSVQSRGAYTNSAGRYAITGLRYMGTNVWRLTGDIA